MEIQTQDGVSCMIDTDKYEGHYTYHESSVELWNTDDAVSNDYDMFWVTNSNQLNADIERANATINLIQDAPLLLAEVKRLQERLDWILGDEELAGYVWEKEVAYMEWEGVRLPWISADEWGEEE